MNLPETIASLCPHASPKGLAVIAKADEVLPAFGINSPLRIAHFLAQALHETGGLQRLEENMCYSAKRLMAVWPKRFPTIESALPYAWDPTDPDREDIALADVVYGARMGNESNGTNDDDGWLYRGQGIIPLTGLANYREVSRILGVDLVAHPEWATQPDYALPSGCAYWNWKRLSPLADKDDLRAITKLINGGYIGLEDRANWLAKAKAALHA